MQPGDKDGFGRYGHLDGDDELVLCHECGGYYRSLASHVILSHEMSADQYRAEHGIPQRLPLTSPAMRRAQSERSRSRVDTAAWDAMTEKRDPTAAAHARTKESFIRRGEDLAAQIETAKANIKGVRKPLSRRCATCGKLIGSRQDGNRTGKTCSPLCERILRYETRMAAASTSAREIAARVAAGESKSSIGRSIGVSNTAIRVRIEKWNRYLADCEMLGREPKG